MKISSNSADTQDCRGCLSSTATGSTMVDKFKKSLPAVELEPRSGIREGAKRETLGVLAKSVGTTDPKWLMTSKALQWQYSPQIQVRLLLIQCSSVYCVDWKP